ncbi:sigma-70 family RNA polymerase sigma factor [Microbispora sp. RL4-1S]|uniref:Sigma-70 family RNA polymerase sigma factor n=1 Tax=Microbispora oryzae TaxID=2806554 RepID=A0A941AGM1_9ACTN|nr:sigma-70 family RNA polymerase sigma factor [Microbispora oryzae]MBP2703090.1 sigma-70 family RNA polymerase sigma factor [Microbispora oryzae]
MPGETLTDAELTRAAQSGEVAALGALLERHQAGMRAVALSLLGLRPDVDDVVQDAALVALRRIGDVRDPAAVGPWLRAIVRNSCRMRLRATADVPFDEEWARPADPQPGVPSPERALDGHALRDWIWHAIGQLSPQLRLALTLRHFTGVTSYEQIAAACEVPIGTVRSRLAQARATMARALLATADAAHDDAARLTAARHREGLETLAAAERGAFAEVVADRWWPEMELRGGGGERGGRDFAVRGMECDLAAGVRQRLRHTVAARDLIIWEMDMTSPPDDPAHCPPAVTWLMFLEGSRVRRLRLFHPAPS